MQTRRRRIRGGRFALWLGVLIGVLVAVLAGAQETEPAPASIAPDDCSACHDGHGRSGHRAGCAACHVPGEASAEGEHVGLATAGCPGCHETPASAERHAPVREERCEVCHDPHGTQKSPYLAQRTEGQVCAACHEVTDTRFVHTEVRLGRCSNCHDAHGSEHPSLLVSASPNASCVGCHASHADAEPFPHWPTEQKRCDTCHDAHGSDHAGNLHLPPEQVCYQCHPPKDTRAQVHSAVKLGRCATCHDPHGSDYDRKLRADPVADVCFTCHFDDIGGRRVVHAPVAEGNCLMCHDPHTTDFPKNLRASVNTTCGSCHPDKLRLDVQTPHPAVQHYGCTVCHDPHATDNDYRLRKPIVELCTTCHKGFDDGYHVVQRPQGGGHPIGGRDDPLRPGRELVCTSCHDPHGTENPRMWYRAFTKLSLCVECHRKSLAPGTAVGESAFEIEAARLRARALEREREKEQGDPE